MLNSCEKKPIEVTKLKQETLPEQDAPSLQQAENRLKMNSLGTSSAALFRWESLPEGWVATPPRSTFYLASFQIEGGILCDIASTGGGIEANLQRWYAQFGQSWPAQGLESFEKIPLNNQQGYLIELTGRYQPAGQGRPAQNNTGLIGAAALIQGNQVITVKMTGKAPLVAAQLENFKALCASLQQES